MSTFRITLSAGVAVTLLAAGATFAAKSQNAKSGAIERGKYLTTLMGCGDCHTPGTFISLPDFKRQLSGSEMGWQMPNGVVYAANLTPDPETGLGKWSDAQIVQAIRTGNRPDGRQLAPIMPWMNYAALTDEDADAIVAYLRSIPAVKHAVPAPVAAGTEVQGPVLRMPPPSAWDVPPGSSGGH